MTSSPSCHRGGAGGLPLVSSSSSSGGGGGKYHINNRGGGGSGSRRTSIIAYYVQRSIVLLVLLRFSLYLLWMHSYVTVGPSPDGGGRRADPSSPYRYYYDDSSSSRRSLDTVPGIAVVDLELDPSRKDDPSKQYRQFVLKPDGASNSWFRTTTKVAEPPKLPPRSLPNAEQNRTTTYSRGGRSQVFVSYTYSELKEKRRAVQQIRARERAARTRPALPLSVDNYYSSDLGAARVSLDPLDNPAISKTTLSAPRPSADAGIDWPALCRQASFTSKSRLVVTNVLDDLSTAFTLLVLKQCGVRSVLGIDTIFPNVRKNRIQRLDGNYRLLFRNIPNFALKVPASGFYKKDRTMKWLMPSSPSDFPTHIVHFERSEREPPGDDDDASDLMNMEANSQYLHRHSHSLLTWESAFVYAKETGKLRKSSTTPPALVHVSTPSTPVLIRQLSPIVALAQQQQQGTRGAIPATFLYLPVNTTLVGPLLPPIEGAGGETQRSIQEASVPTKILYVEDAVTAILRTIGLNLGSNTEKGGSSTGIVQLKPEWPPKRTEWAQAISTSGELPDSVSQQRLNATLAWKKYQEYPYGPEPKHQIRKNATDPASARLFDTYGIQPRHFPCASACSTQFSCRSSAWDKVRDVSLRQTENCRWVVYLVELSSDLDQLVQPTGGDEWKLDELCRIAFVSGKSPIVSSQISKALSDNEPKVDVTPDQLELFNGKIVYNQWTLIWLINDDEESLNDADSALPRIDPQGLFAETVSKALYAEVQSLVEPSDYSLARILSQIDQPALGRRRKRERRSGTNIARFVSLAPEPARHTIFFAGEPKQSSLPRAVSDFSRIAGDRFFFPSRQLAFYEQIAHLVQTNDLRPEPEIRSTVYFSFPFQWITMAILVHDFNAEASRQFRCSWFDEYIYWGGNRDAEELSFAYVIGKKRIEESMGPPLEDDSSWSRLLQNNNKGLPKTNPKGGEFFVRIMKHREGA